MSSPTFSRRTRTRVACATLWAVVAATACGAAAASAAPAALQNRAETPPNVVFILVDDLGYGDLGSYGQEKIQTPRLDQMAAEGLRFTQFYAGAPVCGPSRATLLTGLHTGHVAMRGNPRRAVGWDIAHGDPPLPDGQPTFAKLYRDAGYETAVIGKWGFGQPGLPGDPDAMGFDFFYGYDDHRDAHHHFPDHLWRDAETFPLDEKTFAQDLFTDEALAFIERAQGGPFMLYLNYALPHSPMEVPDVGEHADRDWPEKEKVFASMITRLDDDVGEVLDKLEALGLDDDTLVIFTSDNGPHAEGGHDPEFFDSNGPLRGTKRAVYEGGIRVPMIARWPGHIDAGRTSDHVAAFWDFLPTTADLLGLPPVEGVDGLSFLPTLLGDSAEQRAHDYLYWETGERGGRQAVRKGDWKAVRLNVSERADAPVKLFDLAADVGENNDLAGQHPDLARQLGDLMDAAHVPADMFPLTPEELAAAGG